MMTEPLRVSVVAAPLAAIDPRALSQAWYSALHLARQRPAQSTLARATSREPQRALARPVAAGFARREAHAATLPSRTRSCDAAGIRAEAVPGRRTRPGFERRIEAALVRPPRTARATFVVTDGSKRTLVVLQTRPGATHVIAICAPEHRQAVASALDAVRRSLRARGIVVQSRVQSGAACS